jgi:hypothetical protein
MDRPDDFMRFRSHAASLGGSVTAARACGAFVVVKARRAWARRRNLLPEFIGGLPAAYGADADAVPLTVRQLADTADRALCRAAANPFNFRRRRTSHSEVAFVGA